MLLFVFEHNFGERGQALGLHGHDATKGDENMLAYALFLTTQCKIISMRYYNFFAITRNRNHRIKTDPRNRCPYSRRCYYRCRKTTNWTKAKQKIHGTPF